MTAAVRPATHIILAIAGRRASVWATTVVAFSLFQNRLTEQPNSRGITNPAPYPSPIHHGAAPRNSRASNAQQIELIRYVVNTSPASRPHAMAARPAPYW